MRLLTGSAIALLGLLLVPGLAGASHGGAGGGRDFAVGAGTFGDPQQPTSVQRVDFAASGGPSPLPVTGHFRAGGAFDLFGISEFQQEGPVTCLVVVGDHQARLVYPIKQARPGMNEDREVLIFIEDNGPPQNGQPTDKLGFVLLPVDEDPEEDPPSEQDTECFLLPFPLPAPLTPFTPEKGNFTVHQAP
jgi:hypothetical protein